VSRLQQIVVSFCLKSLNYWLSSMNLVVLNEKSFCFFFHYFNPFIMKLNISLVFLFVFSVVIMLVNTFSILFRLSWIPMVFFVKPPVHNPITKWGGEVKKIDTLLNAISSIACHLLSSTTKWLNLFCSLVNLSIPWIPKSSDLPILFSILVIALTNCHLRLCLWFFL